MAFKALMAFFGSIANLSAGGPCYLHLDARDAASIFEEINRPACRKLVVMLKLLVLRIGNKEKKKKKKCNRDLRFHDERALSNISKDSSNFRKPTDF